MRFWIFRIAVTIHPSFWLFLLFFSNLIYEPTLKNLIVGGIALLSLLVHELGHAFMGKTFGAEPEIILEAFGGTTRYRGARLSEKQSFLITLGGPLLESTLIALPYFLLKSGLFTHLPLFTFFLFATLKINLIWCGLNLLPIIPFDGGHLLRYPLEKRWGASGTKACFVIGTGCAALGAPLLVWKGFFFLGTLLVILGVQNYKLLRAMGDPAYPCTLLTRGNEGIQRGDRASGKKLLKQLLKEKDPLIKHSAIESLATALIEEGEMDKAYELLQKGDPTFLKRGKCLLCKLAYEKGDYSVGALYALEAYTLIPTFDTAYLNAKIFARLGQDEHALGWIDTATKFQGHENQREQLLQDPAFDHLKLPVSP